MKIMLSLFSLFLMTSMTFVQAMEPEATEIFNAAKDGDVAAAELLIKQNPSLVKAQDENGNTPLHWAARRGRTFSLTASPDSRGSVETNNPAQI